MKLKKLLITLAALVSLFPNILRAETYKMIFWYPGEAGSTELAQPTIDAFFAYINKRVAPDKIEGSYINTQNEGLRFIKDKKAKLGIISFAAIQINKDKLPRLETILKTRPLPSGKAEEEYVIVGNGPAPKDWDAVPLYSKQPLTGDFVKRYMLPETVAPKITVVTNIIPTLKDVSMGAKKGGVILQPIEYFSLGNIDQPWAKSLKVWKKTSPLPSAPVVVFGASSDGIMKIKGEMLKMADDAEGKEILNSLRLAGFAE